MKSKFYLATGIVLMLVFVFAFGTAAAQPPQPCDPAYVVRTGKVFRVSPTGVDDTANIQCAFDAAIVRGPGTTVWLKSGTFHTAQIVVIDFHGAFKGNGIHKTEVVNLPNLYVAPDVEAAPPSADHPWPDLFIFIDSDVALSNMALRIAGQNPVTPWYLGDWGPFYEMANVIMFSGTESDALVSNVSLEGEPMPSSPMGYNTINGIYFEGYVTAAGANYEPLSGVYSVRGSSFKSMVSSTPVFNLSNASVVIKHNTYSDVTWAVEDADLVETAVQIVGNRIETNDAGVGIFFTNYTLTTDVDTDYVIRNNIVEAPVGVAMYQTMDAASTCLIKNNNLRWVTDTPIFLGEGAQACRLVNNHE